MKRVNLLAASGGSAAAIVVVELLGEVEPVLAESPWPWLSAALFVAFAALRCRSPLSAVAAIALVVAAHSSYQRADFARTNADLVGDGQVARQFRGHVDGPVGVSGNRIRFALDTERGRLLVIAEHPPSSLWPGDAIALWGRSLHGRTYRSPGTSKPSSRTLRASGHAAVVFARGSDIKVLARGGHSVWRTAAMLQRASSQTVEARGGSPRGNAIVRALVAGDRQAIDSELSAVLRAAGVAHLLAVSGLHLAVVSVFVFVACRRLWSAVPALSSRLEPQTAAALIAIAASTLYTLVTGARPSAMRALLVAAIILAGLATFRKANALDALGGAALLLLALRPALLFDPSFQMSMSAALVLAFAFAKRRPAALGWLARGRRLIGDLTTVAALALLATAPTSVGLYGELPFVGILLNVVAVPLVELVVLPLALAGTALSYISPAAGGVLLDISIATAGAIAALAELVSSRAQPLAVQGLSALELLCLYAALLGAIVTIRFRAAGRDVRFALAATVALSGLVVALLVAGTHRDASGNVVVTFLDVGQGDAAVIEFPTGEVWLIDAGGRPFATDPAAAAKPGAESVLPFLRHRRIDRIDVAVISHAHPDHFAGFAALVGEVEIATVYVAAPDPDQQRPEDLTALLLLMRVMGSRVAEPPRALAVGSADVRFLAPRYRGRIAVDPVSSVNDNSIAVRVAFAGRSVLFAGDLEDEGEELLIAASRREQRRERDLTAGRATQPQRPLGIDVDVVKANHHGSKTSSSAAWIAATSPIAVVVSCGRRNRFGFPHPDVVARFRAVGAAVLRTDLGGAITVELTRRGEIGWRSHVALPHNGTE